MNKPTHEKIYLVPEDGIYCWSTTPVPGAQHESNDAVEYVRGDLFEALKAECDALIIERDMLAHRFNDVSIACKISNSMIDKTKAERDALAAQNELLRKLWNAAQPDIVRLFEIQPVFGDNEKEVDGQSCHELQQAFASTPEQCLREIEAEAGRKGYYEGFRAGIVIDAPLLPPQSGASAIDHFRVIVDQTARVNAYNYAAKVRQGGAE